MQTKAVYQENFLLHLNIVMLYKCMRACERSPRLSKQKKSKGKCSYEVKVVYGDHGYDVLDSIGKYEGFIKDRR